MARSKKSNFFVADIETKGDSQIGMSVWLWGLTNRKRTFFSHGTDLDSMMYEFTKLLGRNPLVYLHNLRFDGSFIIVWLLLNGYEYVDRIDSPKQFTSIITDMGLFYAIEFSSDNGKIITMHDSLKKIPLRVADMSKAYGLGIDKLEMDYTKKRDGDHEVTEEELEYQQNDVYVPAEVLDIQYSQGLTRMTSSSDAMADFKQRIGKTNFKKFFPILQKEIDEFCRLSYKGGYTHVKTSVAGIEVGRGRVWDVHSMYPGVMDRELLPYGDPVYFEGEIDKGILETYPLYIVRIRVDFILKKDMLPTIQIKNDIRFKSNEYLEKSYGEVYLHLTNVDYELFLKHYDTIYLEEIGAYYFKGAYGIFKDFISYWYGIKSDVNSPKPLVTISKLKLNGLYGKFGTNPENKIKIPFLNEDGALRFTTVQKEDKDTVYVPMASFITSYARAQVITSAQSIYPYFCYADTDSIHHVALPDDEDINDYLNITDDTLGTWGFEADFEKAIFYRAKGYKEYIYNKDGDLVSHVKMAGLKSNAYILNDEAKGKHPDDITEDDKVYLQDFDFNEFHLGIVFEQLKSRQVKGGVELYIAPYEVK